MRRALLLLLLLPAFAQPAGRRPPTTNNEKPKTDALSLTRPVEVTADRLEILGKENRAVYSGNARASRDGAAIRCEELTVSYDTNQQVQKVEATGGVEVTEGDRWAKGERAELDNLSGVLVVTGAPEARSGQSHVTGSKVTFTVGNDLVEVEDPRTVFAEAPGAPGGKKRVRIDAQRLTVHGRRQLAVWSGRVRAKRGGTDIATETLLAHYGADQELERLEAVGGVEVRDGERWARGQRAELDNLRGVLVVTGDPEARQGPNLMRGTKVTFVVGRETLEVENARTVFETEGGVPKLLERRR